VRDGYVEVTFLVESGAGTWRRPRRGDRLHLGAALPREELLGGHLAVLDRSSRFDPAGILAATSNKAVRAQSGAISNAGCA